MKRTSISRSEVRCNLAALWRYGVFYVLILLALSSNGAVSTSSTIFKQQDESSPHSSKKSPPNVKCDKIVTPTYTLKEDGQNFFLIVDLHRVSRKNLDVSVNFETGMVDILAWRFESTEEQKEELLQIEAASKTCIHREWQLDMNAADTFDLEGLVMGLNDGLLTISVPKLEGSTPTKKSERDRLRDSRKDRQENKQQSQEKENYTPRVEAKKLRGFRQSITRNDTSTTPLSPRSNSKSLDYPVTENPGLPSPKSQQKQLLERFLLVSLTDTDEAAYWLHKM